MDFKVTRFGDGRLGFVANRSDIEDSNEKAIADGLQLAPLLRPTMQLSM
jgi:hypothetical protein